MDIRGSMLDKIVPRPVFEGQRPAALPGPMVLRDMCSASVDGALRCAVLSNRKLVPKIAAHRVHGPPQPEREDTPESKPSCWRMTCRFHGSMPTPRIHRAIPLAALSFFAAIAFTPARAPASPAPPPAVQRSVFGR